VGDAKSLSPFGIVINILVESTGVRGVRRGEEQLPILVMVQKLLDVELTITEWLGTAVIVNLPYLALGVVWSVAHADRFTGLHGGELLLALVGAVLSWPVLLLPSVCAP
jgi:hypothetical protein